MSNVKLSETPVSMKIFLSALMCMLGLIYLSLIYIIWYDTKMNPALVAEGYTSMEALEVAEHINKYLPFYVINLLAIPMGMFMFTSFSENLKKLFVIAPFVFIIVDIFSMWAIRYVSPSFGYVLYFAGSFVAMSFFALFCLNLYDLWLRKGKQPA